MTKFNERDSLCILTILDVQERGENVPPEDSFDVARKVKEMYCYTSSDIVKVIFTSMLIYIE